MRLTGGLNPRQGVVEVFYRGIWGQVASLSSNAATVVCRQLGLGTDGVAASVPTFFPASSKTSLVWKDGDSCQGNEPSFLSCSNDASSWDSSSPLYQVSCYNASTGKPRPTCPLHAPCRKFVLWPTWAGDLHELLRLVLLPAAVSPCADGVVLLPPPAGHVGLSPLIC